MIEIKLEIGEAGQVIISGRYRQVFRLASAYSGYYSPFGTDTYKYPILLRCDECRGLLKRGTCVMVENTEYDGVNVVDRVFCHSCMGKYIIYMEGVINGESNQQS